MFVWPSMHLVKFISYNKFLAILNKLSRYMKTLVHFKMYFINF